MVLMTIILETSVVSEGIHADIYSGSRKKWINHNSTQT